MGDSNSLRGGNLSAPAKDSRTESNLGDLARFRQEAYLLLGSMLLFPTEPTVAAASEAARDALLESHLALDFAFFQPWEMCMRRLEELGPVHLAELEEAYNAVFSGGAQIQAVSLYESSYLQQNVAESGQVIADLEREYGSLGLVISEEEGESPDHVSLELEFLSVLCEQEAIGWEGGDLVLAQLALTRQQRFLKEHMCQWVPSLAWAVVERDSLGIYASVAKAIHALIIHDEDFSGLLGEHLGKNPRKAK